MPTVVGVVFQHPGKTYYFSPDGLDLQVGQRVIIRTSAGPDMAHVSMANHEVPDSEIVPPLKPILRLASEEDLAIAARAEERLPEAIEVARRHVQRSGLEMRLAKGEFSYDGTRVTFYFTSEDRIDFRRLVREIGQELHVRVELRQIGVRDAAGCAGGFGPCGQELCCSRYMTDFEPVSVRLAKEQDLPLNPAKISGTCGRLLCCLRYEYEAYKDFNKRAPKRGAIVDTPAGPGEVAGCRCVGEKVHVRLAEGGQQTFPLEEVSRRSPSQTPKRTDPRDDRPRRGRR